MNEFTAGHPEIWNEDIGEEYRLSPALREGCSPEGLTARRFAQVAPQRD